MSSQERQVPKMDWDTIDMVADEGELHRLQSMSHDELEAELRSVGIEPQRADQVVQYALAKAETGGAPASGVGLSVLEGSGKKATPRGRVSRVVAWVSGSVAGIAAAAALFMRLVAPPLSVVVGDPGDHHAAQLRAEAEAACGKKAWAECEQELNAARELDPRGEGDSRVIEERKAIAAHLHNGVVAPWHN
jgi:hypothetical protein